MQNLNIRINTSRTFLSIISFLLLTIELPADDLTLARVVIQEPIGIARSLEYVEIQLQLNPNIKGSDELNIIAEDHLSGERIVCQIAEQQDYENEGISILNVIFPISIQADERKEYLLKRVKLKPIVNTNLKVSGGGLNLIIDNKFYSADLSMINSSDGKNKNSGQLNELKIKMGFDKLLFRSENRIHWAPNFQRHGLENYSTIAGWESPNYYILNSGSYLVSTARQDYAVNHPEILLTANYSFYEGLPYFKFFSSMKMESDIYLDLLRNDEMTMDSLFTNIAYQNNRGEIIDLPFSKRYKELESNPIQNDAPWLCFYNEKEGYAFGSIRIKYDITNDRGLESPTYQPHTKISDGANGGKYWNRRLINDHPTYVPKGSSYIEKNAYLVFKIGNENKFSEILNWMNILRNPVNLIVLCMSSKGYGRSH